MTRVNKIERRERCSQAARRGTAVFFLDLLLNAVLCRSLQPELQSHKRLSFRRFEFPNLSREHRQPKARLGIGWTPGKRLRPTSSETYLQSSAGRSTRRCPFTGTFTTGLALSTLSLRSSMLGSLAARCLSRKNQKRKLREFPGKRTTKGQNGLPMRVAGLPSPA